MFRKYYFIHFIKKEGNVLSYCDAITDAHPLYAIEKLKKDTPNVSYTLVSWYRISKKLFIYNGK